MKVVVCAIAWAVVNFAIQSSSWGQIQQFEISGNATFRATGVTLGTAAFSGSFSIDPSSLDNNSAINEGLFDLVDVDIDAGSSIISAGTLSQRLGSSGQLEQTLFFSTGSVGLGFTISLESDNTLTTDPNTIALFDSSDVSVRVGLVEEFGETTQLNSFSFEDVTPSLPGDCNLDGVVNFLDIGPFISFLSAGFYLASADTNEDGVVSFLDISPFIALLSL